MQIAFNSPNATPRGNLTLFHAKNEDADQPVHPISACIIRSIFQLVTSKGSVFFYTVHPQTCADWFQTNLHVSTQSEDQFSLEVSFYYIYACNNFLVCNFLRCTCLKKLFVSKAFCLLIQNTNSLTFGGDLI